MKISNSRKVNSIKLSLLDIEISRDRNQFISNPTFSGVFLPFDSFISDVTNLA